MRRRDSIDVTASMNFVVGAPRSGTTLLHALACTAEGANPYIAECSYVTALVNSFGPPWGAFDIHTSYYFSDREDFVQYHAGLIRSVLQDIVIKLGNSKILVLKDPNLTLSFPLLAQLLPETKFLLTVRDPRDVVASRIRVERRRNADAPINLQFVHAMCNEYVSHYRPYLKHQAELGDRVLVLGYEDLARGGCLDRLAVFLGAPLHPQKLWRGSVTDIKDYEASEWYSLQYGQPVNADSIGSYQSILPKEATDMIEANCGPIAAALGFPLIPGNG